MWREIVPSEWACGLEFGLSNWCKDLLYRTDDCVGVNRPLINQS